MSTPLYRYNSSPPDAKPPSLHQAATHRLLRTIAAQLCVLMLLAVAAIAVAGVIAVHTRNGVVDEYYAARAKIDPLLATDPGTPLGTLAVLTARADALLAQAQNEELLGELLRRSNETGQLLQTLLAVLGDTHEPADHARAARGADPHTRPPPLAAAMADALWHLTRVARQADEERLVALGRELLGAAANVSETIQRGGLSVRLGG